VLGILELRVRKKQEDGNKPNEVPCIVHCSVILLERIKEYEMKEMRQVYIKF
jgi:hypothetical protein